MPSKLPKLLGVILSILVLLVLVNIGFWWGARDWLKIEPNQTANLEGLQPKVASAQTKPLPQATVGQAFDQGTYQITWSNPHYEDDPDLGMRTFRVDLNLVNTGYPGQLKKIVNCDLADGENTINGIGVTLEDNTVIVPLEIDYQKQSQEFALDDEPLFPNRKVTGCQYTPSGSYDPNLAVAVNF